MNRVGRVTKNPSMSARIMLVDDNEDLLKITQLILTSQGYEVFVASSIDTAAQLLTRHQPALILLDMCICEEDDGRAYCLQLKEEATTKYIRIILMSGNEYDRKELHGADGFLQKPFDVTDLTDMVAKQLAQIQEPIM